MQVRPSPGPAGGEPGALLNIELVSPYGQARFATPAREVTDFAHRAYQIARDGQESGHIDLDAELNALSARRHKKSSRLYDGGSSSRARGSQTTGGIPRTA